MRKEIEITTRGSSGGQAIPVRVADAVELTLVDADAIANRTADPTTMACGDTTRRRVQEAAQQ